MYSWIMPAAIPRSVDEYADVTSRGREAARMRQCVANSYLLINADARVKTR